MRGDPRPVRAPRLGLLHRAEGLEELLRVAEADGLVASERVECRAHVGLGLRDEQRVDDEAACGLVRSERRGCCTPQGVGVAGDPAGGVEGRRERDEPVSAHRAVRRAQPPQPLVRGRNADAARRIRRQSDSRLAERNRAGRAARRPTRNAADDGRVGRGAVVRVAAGDRVGELIGLRDAGHVGAGGEQRTHGGRAAQGGLGGVEVLGDSRADREPRHVVEVFHRNRLAGQGARRGTPHERRAHDAPDSGVDRRPGQRDVGRAHLPAALHPRPELGLLPAPAGERLGDGDDEGRVVVDRNLRDVQDRALRRSPAPLPERADRVMPGQDARGIPAHRVVREQLVQHRQVVGHEGLLVPPERVDSLRAQNRTSSLARARP